MAKRKKKNQTTLISLLVVLVLLAGFYVWYLNRDKFGASSRKRAVQIPIAIWLLTPWIRSL